MKVLKGRRSSLRSLWRGGLVILSIFALAFAAGCGSSNDNDVVVQPPVNGPNGPDVPPTAARHVTNLQILDQPTARTVQLEGQVPNLIGTRVMLTWNDNSTPEVVTINAANRYQFHTFPRFIRHASATAFDAADPAFTHGYSMAHITQNSAQAGGNLRLGIMRTISSKTDHIADTLVPIGERNPLITVLPVAQRPSFFEDRVLLDTDEEIFAGITVQILYDEVPAISGNTQGFNGPAIPRGHMPVALSVWNLNEEPVFVDPIENPLYYSNELFVPWRHGNTPPAFMGLQHRTLDQGWMHIRIGEDSDPRTIRFPVDITIFPVVEIVPASDPATWTWSPHFQFTSSVPTGRTDSDWWIEEVFVNAGGTFRVYYAHTPAGVSNFRLLTWQDVLASRARGFDQAVLVGGAPDFFVDEVDEIFARIGWFSRTQLQQHANPAQTLPNQVLHLAVPVWALDGEAEFVDRPGMAALPGGNTLVIESPTVPGSQPLNPGVIGQVFERYQLALSFSLMGHPQSPTNVYVNRFFWDETIAPATPTSFTGVATHQPGTSWGWGNQTLFTQDPEGGEVMLTWTFPTTAGAFANVTPIVGTVSHLEAPNNTRTFNFSPPAGSQVTAIRNAFAGIGGADLPREGIVLPATPTP